MKTSTIFSLYIGYHRCIQIFSLELNGNLNFTSSMSLSEDEESTSAASVVEALLAILVLGRCTGEGCLVGVLARGAW